MSPAPEQDPRPAPRIAPDLARSPRALLTEAEQLCRPASELDAASPLVCADPRCAAGPTPDGARVACQEVWFTCQNGHLNAVGLSDWQAAA